MNRVLPAILPAVLFLALPLAAASQEHVDQTPGATETAVDEDSWYSSPTADQLTPRMIIFQKAQARAYQRIARMESMHWYGMSAARPRYSATPFTGIPTPRWEMPGGRPSAWTPYQGPQVYIVR